ncbi:MAG: hypothetical protein KDC92_15650, partial [Bacteroidetes bacterium]|nr:hypothetical protein [Bacteroidota bacterium]
NVLELQKVNQEAKLLKQDHQINLLILLTGLVASIVAGVFLLLNSYKRRKALEIERKLTQLQIENQLLEEERLIQELDSQKSDITQLALENTRKRAWNREFIDRIKELKKEKNIGVDKLIKELELELNNQVYLDDKIGVFQDKIDQVNADFYTSLDKNYPGLTKGERELCGMIKLNLSGKEIANVRNVDPRSVSKAKQRLRNKLNLAPNADLYHLMDTLN